MWKRPVKLRNVSFPRRSIKALETSSKSDDTQWLMYWVVFSCFSVLEFFSDALVGWVPFYWLVKVIILVLDRTLFHTE